MAESDKQAPVPVLVTGSVRSGTTWVGQMLACGGELQYISEPLNRWRRPQFFPTPLRTIYTYICTDNEAAYLPAFRRLVKPNRWLPPRNLRALEEAKDLLRVLRDVRDFSLGSLRRQRPLLKDPYALFSSGWFAERLACRVVIVYRHPVPFVSSMKRLGWTVEMDELLEQPLLMRDWLEPYREEMEACLRGPDDDVVGQASLLWKMQYEVVRQLCAKHPGFITVRHEDLSLRPLAEFERLYQALGLAFTEEARQAISEATGSSNPRELPEGDPHRVRMNSKASLGNWRKRLDEAEAERVMRITGELRRHLYGDELPG